MEPLFCILRQTDNKIEAAIANQSKLLMHLSNNAEDAETTSVRIIEQEQELIDTLAQKLKDHVVYTFDGKKLFKLTKKSKLYSSIRFADLKPMTSSMCHMEITGTKQALEQLDFKYDPSMYQDNTSLVLSDLRACCIIYGNLASQRRLPEMPEKNTGYPLGTLRLIYTIALIIIIVLLIISLV